MKDFTTLGLSLIYISHCAIGLLLWHHKVLWFLDDYQYYLFFVLAWTAYWVILSKSKRELV